LPVGCLPIKLTIISLSCYNIPYLQQSIAVHHATCNQRYYTDKDYYLAVYLYNNESKAVACATLSEVTDEEEVKYYENLVTSDTAAAEETATETPVGDTAGGGFLMTSAYVVGVSFLLSAINFIAA
jgi:hypothetical protein